jgi:hypothetical protein
MNSDPFFHSASSLCTNASPSQSNFFMHRTINAQHDIKKKKGLIFLLLPISMDDESLPSIIFLVFF